MTAEDVVFLNSMRWDFPVPSPGKHMAVGLAARHRVLYVEPAGNALRGDGGRPLRQVGERIWVQPRWRLPVYFARRVERLTTALMRTSARLAVDQVSSGAKTLDMRSPVICNALAPDVSVTLCDRLRPKAVVYFATDAIEGMNPPRALWACEREWVERADCVVCSSESLADRFMSAGRRVELLLNGADIDLFENAGAQEEPDAVRGLPRPRAAYAGTLDFRCDTEAICSVADVMPVIAVGHATSAEVVRRLRAHHNVHYIGAVPQPAVPAYLGAADVLLMPYVDNLATRFMHPMKLYEYLATGRPVVASRLPALTPFDGLVTIATAAGFGRAALAEAAGGDQGAEARVSAARSNSWGHRVEQLEQLLAELVDSR